MSYDSKIQSARKVIEQHNFNVEESHKVDFDKFLENLRNLGGTSEETLKAVSWEDLQDCGIPKIMARSLSHIFRQASSGNGEKTVYVSNRKASTMTPTELLERYNPRDVKNAVGGRLEQLSDGKRFIVFTDGKVNVEESKKLLEDLMDGHDELATAFVDGLPTSVYKVGERPDSYADENPIYPGRALRASMTCDQTGRSWDGVSLPVRQLLYLARKETKELNISSLDDAHNAIDKAMADNAETIIRQRYKKASLLYDECSQISQLPTLKIKMGSGSKSKSNNPFGANRTF